MKLLLKNGQVWLDDRLRPAQISVCDGIVSVISSAAMDEGVFDRVFDLSGCVVFPGFCDVHVHLREPGFSEKETIRTGSRACAAGGYTTVCAMPNLSPAPDSPEHLAVEEALIARDAVIRVLPFASITVGQRGEGELVDFDALAPRVAGFSDDGRGVKTAETMRGAMTACRKAGSLISAHCEDMELIPPGGCCHAGEWAAGHGLPGIPSESEWKPIERDIALVRETGCRYHVCHVSCRESVELIRRAKAEGLPVSCETAPHYLLLCEEDLPEEPLSADAARFKMNPPLRSARDRDALLEGLLDGTIDCIATDHAPHTAEEKAKGFLKAPMGIVGIETAFPLLYTHLVETGRLPLSLLVEKLTDTPRRLFGLDGGLQLGGRAELSVWDLNADGRVEPSRFLSMGRATPFAGWPVHARCRLTVCGDRVAYEDLRG